MSIQLCTQAVGPNQNPGRRDWLSARGAAEPASQSQRRCVVWHLERCEASPCAFGPPHPALVAMSPTLPMLTTDRSQKAAGRRLRIVHDGHRSARPHRRRHPHLIKRTEISTRSNEQSKMRGARAVPGWKQLVSRTQYSRLSWLYLERVLRVPGPARGVLISHIICCRWGLKRHGTGHT